MQAEEQRALRAKRAGVVLRQVQGGGVLRFERDAEDKQQSGRKGGPVLPCGTALPSGCILRSDALFAHPAASVSTDQPR